MAARAGACCPQAQAGTTQRGAPDPRWRTPPVCAMPVDHERRSAVAVLLRGVGKGAELLRGALGVITGKGAGMTIEELIAALERAEGPSDDLDLAIARWCLTNGCIAGVDYDPELWLIRNGGEFTFSIDAALSLVPDGWHATINARPDWPTVELNEFPLPCRSVKLLHARTASIALCIAALKARAAT